MEKKVRFVDRYNRTLTVPVALYLRLLNVRGFVKYFIDVVYVWTKEGLINLVRRLGIRRFIKEAGSNRYGKFARKLAIRLVKDLIKKLGVQNFIREAGSYNYGALGFQFATTLAERGAIIIVR